MKHQKIQPHYSDMPVPGLSDKDIEARIFRNLEAEQKKWAEREEGAVIIFEYPDNRTLFQRVAVSWYLKSQCRQPVTNGKHSKTGIEPEWQGHWATTKYL